jgi:hypothetical protein
MCCCQAACGLNAVYRTTLDNLVVGTTFDVVLDCPGPTLTCDYNSDGIVNAADYVVWRKNEGTMASLPNDNGIGGAIGQAHYNLWRTHIGQSTSGTISQATVPEPASALLLILASTVRCWTQRRFTPRVL